MGSAKRKYGQAKVRPSTKGAHLKLVKPADDPAIEEALARQTAEAGIELRKTRGEVFRVSPSKMKPHRCLDELDIMLSRGEITEPQYRAGRNYGDRYREGLVKGIYRSSIAVNNRSSTGDDYDEFFVKRMTVFVKLRRDKRAGLGGNVRLIRICDKVLGEDFRITNDRGDRSALVDELSKALTLLAQHYGYIWGRR